MSNRIVCQFEATGLQKLTSWLASLEAGTHNLLRVFASQLVRANLHSSWLAIQTICSLWTSTPLGSALRIHALFSFWTCLLSFPAFLFHWSRIPTASCLCSKSPHSSYEKSFSNSFSHDLYISISISTAK